MHGRDIHIRIPCIQDMYWPGGIKKYLTALLLRRLYAQWTMMNPPSRVCTLSTPLIVTLCSVLLQTEYIAPGKAVLRSWPPFGVQKCMQFGSVKISLCLQMRVSWSEQSPWSCRETLKAAVSSVQRDIIYVKCSICAYIHVNTYIHTVLDTDLTFFRQIPRFPSEGGCGYPRWCARIFSTIPLWFSAWFRVKEILL